MTTEHRPTIPDVIAESGWDASRTLDASDLRCPLPVLKARKVLLAMAANERLLLITTDPMSAIDVPHFCGESGNQLIRQDQHGETRRYLIRKIEDPGQAT
ncbi:MAG: sulfurtransferase TusA family protein [Alphaproteobacteria bacterium]